MRPLGIGKLGALCMVALLGAVTQDSPIADAAMRGDAEAVRELVRQGADVNAAQGDGMTALHWAAANGDFELAKLLMYAGAHLEAVTRHGSHTPLHVAAASGRGEVVRALVEAGANVAATTTAGVTALHQAARAGSVEAVTALLEHGAEVDAQESAWQQTPLVFAAALDRAEVIRVLLAHGADPNAYTAVRNLGELSALDGQARAARVRVLDAFREQQGGDGNWRPGPREVQAAVRAAHQIQLGLGTVEGGAADEGYGGGDEPLGPSANTQGGLTPLLHAAREGHLAAVLALLEGGADINQAKRGDEYTPLLMAVINGHYDLALVLLEKGADPNLAANDGVAPLFAVISNYWGAKTRYPQPMHQHSQKASYLETMEALLKAGADPDQRLRRPQWYLTYTFGSLGVDMTGATAFWRATHAVDLAAMQLLVEYGADHTLPTLAPPPRTGGRGGGFGLDADPAGRGDPSGLPPVAPGDAGVYPVHAAAGVSYGQSYTANFHQHAPNGWMPAMRYLVEELGHDVNVRDLNGYNAVHHAASRGDNEMILFLVEHGADVMAVSRRGQTTVDMANGPGQRISPLPATIALLESMGAKNNNNCVSC